MTSNQHASKMWLPSSPPVSSTKLQSSLRTDFTDSQNFLIGRENPWGTMRSDQCMFLCIHLHLSVNITTTCTDRWT